MFEGKGIRTVIIAAIVIFIGIITFLYLQSRRSEIERVEAQEQVENITRELDKAMEEMLELEVLSEDREEQIEIRETMLKEKIAEVTSLKERIKELRRQGLIDKKVIETLEEKLDQLEQEVTQYSLEELDRLVAQVKDREDIIDSISKNTINLRNENDALRNQLEAANIVPDVPETPNNATGLPYASNFKFFNVAAGQKRPVITPNASDLAELEVCFNLLGGVALNVPAGDYDLYMEYYHPNGETATTALSDFRTVGDSGNRRLYTTMRTVRLEGDTREVCMLIKLDGESFRKGKQRIVIYCQGEEIGRDILEVQ